MTDRLNRSANATEHTNKQTKYIFVNITKRRRNLLYSQVAPEAAGGGPVVVQNEHHEEGEGDDGPHDLGVGSEEELNSGESVGRAGVVGVRAGFGAEEGPAFGGGGFGRGGGHGGSGGGGVARRDGEGVGGAVGGGGVHGACRLCVVGVSNSVGCATDANVGGGIAGQCLCSGAGRAAIIGKRAGQPAGDAYASGAVGRGGVSTTPTYCTAATDRLGLRCGLGLVNFVVVRVCSLGSKLLLLEPPENENGTVPADEGDFRYELERDGRRMVNRHLLLQQGACTNK